MRFDRFSSSSVSSLSDALELEVGSGFSIIGYFLHSHRVYVGMPIRPTMAKTEKGGKAGIRMNWRQASLCFFKWVWKVGMVLNPCVDDCRLMEVKLGSSLSNNVTPPTVMPFQFPFHQSLSKLPIPSSASKQRDMPQQNHPVFFSY